MVPTYVIRLSKEYHMSISEAESVWKKAVKASKESSKNKEPSPALISNIFKAMMKERGDKTKGKSVKKKK